MFTGFPPPQHKDVLLKGVQHIFRAPQCCRFKRIGLLHSKQSIFLLHKFFFKKRVDGPTVGQIILLSINKSEMGMGNPPPGGMKEQAYFTVGELVRGGKTKGRWDFSPCKAQQLRKKFHPTTALVFMWYILSEK